MDPLPTGHAACRWQAAHPARRGWLVLVLAVSCGAIQAQQARHVLLWRVDAPGSTVYLLGSIHVGRPDFYPLNSYIEEAFRRSTRLAVEVDITRVNPDDIHRSILAVAAQPEGRTLRDEIGLQNYSLLKERLVKLRLPVSMVDRYRPWLVWTWLPAQDPSTRSYDSELGVDLYFLRRAGRRSIIELESASQQLQILAGLPDKEQIRLLRETLAHWGSTSRFAEELVDAWLAGDAAALRRLASRDMGSGRGSATEILLRRRDVAMADKVRELLERPGYSFVVVGALHLLGEGSIVDLLQRDGYAVSIVREARGAGGPP